MLGKKHGGPQIALWPRIHKKSGQGEPLTAALWENPESPGQGSVDCGQGKETPRNRACQGQTSSAECVCLQCSCRYPRQCLVEAGVWGVFGAFCRLQQLTVALIQGTAMGAGSPRTGFRVSTVSGLGFSGQFLGLGLPGNSCGAGVLLECPACHARPVSDSCAPATM